MKLIILFVFTSCIEGLCIQTEKIQENCSVLEKKIRKSRALDESDVINRFEMERVSPLYDLIKQFPPFEDDWIPPAFSNLPSLFTNIPPPPTIVPLEIPPTFKIDVTKDGHHVVSESGRRNGPNSALNWWYAVHSYSNVSEYNYTNNYRYPKPVVSQAIELKTQSPRKLDEDHVFSKVLGSSTGRESSIDEVFLRSETTPRMVSTNVPDSVSPKPNVTTRYILLQSGRIVAINVTSVSAPLMQTSTNGRNPNLPPVFFGSRIRNKNSSNSANPKVQNRADNSPITNLNQELSIQKQQYGVNKNRAEKLIEVTVKQPTVLNKEQAFMRDTTTASTFKNAIKPEITKSTIPLKTITTTTKITTTNRPINIVTKTVAPTTEIPTTKTIAMISTRSTPTTMARTMFSTKAIPTTTARPVAPIRPVLTTVKTLTSTVIHGTARNATFPSFTVRRETLPPKNIIETIFNVLQPGTSKVPFLVVNFDAAKVNLPTVTNSISAAFREAPNRSTFASTPSQTPSSSITTASKESTARNSYYTLHRESPAKNYLYTAPASSNRDKTKYFTSKIEYENENSHKPKILQYSFTTPIKKPAQKIPQTSLTSAIETPGRNENNVKLNPGTKPALKSTPSRELELDDDVYDFSTYGEPLSETSHEFFRIVTLQPTSFVSQASTTLQTRPPGYRGAGHVQQIYPRSQRTTVPSTIYLSHPTTHISVPQSTRRSRQNGFHLRNSVGFQTIPSTALSDRRSYSATTPSPETLATTEPNSVKMRMEEVLAFRFEPTRRSALNAQELGKTSSAILNTKIAPTATPRYRSTAARPNRSSVLFRVQPTKPTASTKLTTATNNQESTAIRKSRFSTTPYPIPARIQRKQDSNLRVQDVKEKMVPASNVSTTISTPKPFRVYFFEPKRKTKKKHEDVKEKESDNNFPTVGTREGRNLQARQPQLNTSPERHPQLNISPKRKPAVNIALEKQPPVNIAPARQTPKNKVQESQPPVKIASVRDRSSEIRRVSRRDQFATPILERPSVTSPRAANRRSTTAIQTENSSLEPSTAVPKKTKKPWYSPYIRHRPNVGTGTTTLHITEDRFSEAPSSVHITRIRNQPTVVSEAVSRRGFRDFERIRRLSST